MTTCINRLRALQERIPEIAALSGTDVLWWDEITTLHDHIEAEIALLSALPPNLGPEAKATVDEAAKKIAAIIARPREALRRIAENDWYPEGCAVIARKALEARP